MEKKNLDPSNNRIPERIEHIHILGICGTGMAALAGMLKERNYHVTGSDQNVYPPMSLFLEQAGISIYEGYRPENLSQVPDLVIVGNVIRSSNPEIAKVAQLELPYLSMPQALAAFFLQDRISLVVAGTHGKTTTSSLLATSLDAAGVAPDFLIGGILENYNRNYNVKGTKYFVVEGDEYDTAFFDKGSKFLHYRPQYAILTSVEFDHADIFADFDAVKKTFHRFVESIPAEGVLIACLDDPVVAALVGDCPGKVVSYGFGQQCDFVVKDFSPNGLRSSFEVVHSGESLGRFEVPMAGRHNALNSAAVIALMVVLGFAPSVICESMTNFKGVKRRQQVRGIVNDITVIDDFAHHPTAVQETTRALRAAWPGNRLVIVFEPRTNSSRRAIFQEKYAAAFQGADEVIVREHIPLDNVPLDQQFSSETLVRSLNAAGVRSQYCKDTDNILQYLENNLRPGDVVAVYSNGGFDNIHERLLQRLKIHCT